MTDELRKAIADYFEVGDFAEYIGITVEDIIDRFEDEVDDALPDLLEIMEYDAGNDED